MNSILLLHDMHALASVHILLQHPHLAGPAPLHPPQRPKHTTVSQSVCGHCAMPVQCVYTHESG